MRKLTIALLLAAGVASAAEAPLAPLEFLVGHCWSGTFPDGKSTDTHCFESSLGGRLIYDKHVVRGDKPDYSGESVWYVDPKSKRVTFMYFNSIGGVSTGTLEEAQGTRLRFSDEAYTGSDGKKQKYRTVWERKGEDGYVALTEQQKGDQWVEAWRIEFKRTPKTGG